MKLLVDLLDSVDCIELDLHTDDSDPEAHDFGYLHLETSRRLDIMVGETIFFKKVEFILDDIQCIQRISRCNQGRMNEYFRYEFDVAAEARRHDERIRSLKETEP